MEILNKRLFNENKPQHNTITFLKIEIISVSLLLVFPNLNFSRPASGTILSQV